MSAQPEFNFTHADYQALHFFLVDAANPDLACRAASIPTQRFNEMVWPAIVPSLRGNYVDFDRFVNAKNILDGDRLRLDYEVRLCQLSRQHQMCVDAYRRTDEYAQQQVAIHATQKDAEPLKQKALTGDIRFLQLARSIRHEMDVLEKKLAERLDQLHEWQQRASSRPNVSPTRQQGTPEIDSPAANHQPPVTTQSPPPPPQGQPAPAAQKPTNQAQSAIHKPAPAEIKAPVAAQLLKPTTTSPLLDREELLAALSPKKIPEITPPPRKQDKYAGVNR